MKKQNSKNLLIVLMTIEILSIIFFWPLGNKQEKKQSPGNLNLHINGNNFINEKNEQIQLKGISTMAFVRYEYNMEELISIFKIFKKDNINLITLYISPDKVYKNKVKLDYIIEWAKNNSIYIFLVPTLDGYYVEKRIDDLMKSSLYLVEKNKKNNNIFYGLWAEPRNVTCQQWKKYYQQFVGKAVKINKKVMIGISGLDYGRTLSCGKDFGYKNIFFTFTDYPSADIEGLAGLEKTNSQWEENSEKYPVIINEFGGVYSSGFGSNEDLSYFKRVLEKANKKKLSYVAYTIDEEGGLSLIDWKTKKLTKKGEIFVKSLNNN